MPSTNDLFNNYQGSLSYQQPFTSSYFHAQQKPSIKEGLTPPPLEAKLDVGLQKSSNSPELQKTPSAQSWFATIGGHLNNFVSSKTFSSIAKGLISPAAFALNKDSLSSLKDGIGKMFGGKSGGSGGSGTQGLTGDDVLGAALDFGSNLVGKDYSGRRSKITSTMDQGTKVASDILMKVPGGQPVALGVKGAALWSRTAQKYLGAGTDKMTTADAILGSDLFGGGALGLINGWTGAKTINLNVDSGVVSNSSYTGTAEEINKAKEFAGKKYGGFSGKARRKANGRIRQARTRQFAIRDIMDDYTDQQNIVDSSSDMMANNLQLQSSGYFNNNRMVVGKKGMKLTDRIKQFKSQQEERKSKPKNLIPSGALHARKNNIETEYHITSKGIPVIMEEGGKAEQIAEIEHSEIILTLDLTKRLEDLYEKYESSEGKEKDKYAIEAGKILTREILHNTDDRVDLIESVA